MTRDDPAAFAPPPAFGPFRVLHQIGIGALGPVFRTYDPTRDRLVAVKVFRLDITPEQSELLAVELAAAADAGLFHPSIVEPIAAGVEGTVAYRAEEYVAAESLDVAIRHYAPAPLDQALPFITQLAGAIDFARTAGVGHGALHLRDLFVTPDEARASGFGIVEALERVGIRAPVRRPYSAPERIAGAAWGTPADVFSLAAIAFELLTARRPSGTGDRIGAFPGEIFGRYSAAIHGVLARAMDDDPARRHPSALALASALEAAARGGHVSDAVGATSAIGGATGGTRGPGAIAETSATAADIDDASAPGKTEVPADVLFVASGPPVPDLDRASHPEPLEPEDHAAVDTSGTLSTDGETLSPSGSASRRTTKRRRAAAAFEKGTPEPRNGSADAELATEVDSTRTAVRADAGSETISGDARLGTGLALAGSAAAAEDGEAARLESTPPIVETANLPSSAANAASETAALPGADDQSDQNAVDDHDVSAERDSDAAHHELLRREVDAMPQPMLFDDNEGAADLALHGQHGPGDVSLGELDDENRRRAQAGGRAVQGATGSGMVFPVPQSSASWDADATAIGVDDDRTALYGQSKSAAGDDGQGMAAERPRPATLPLAVTLVFGLLVGFAAGYAVGDRGRTENIQTATKPASPVPTARGGAALGRTQDGGKAYSEQAVVPPPTPGDATDRGARPAATTGRIVVTSTPSNVGVVVNGVWRGRTPLTLDTLRFGEYSVRIVQAGLTAPRQDLKLTAGDPVHSLAFRLERTRPVLPAPSGRAAPSAGAAPAAPAGRFTGTLFIDSRPRGARVMIDGRAVGTTPARIPEIPVGSHAVRLELSDYRPWTASTRVSASKETRVTGSLERIP